MLHEACAGLLTHAAPEIAIPATKSFTSQLAVLYLFALFLARKRGRIDMAALRAHLKLLLEIPEAMKAALPTWGAQAAAYASEFRHAQSFLYLGRGIHYAIAREGALKLKEISYAHAEGFPTGELKHGPQALIAEGVPVVALVTCDPEDPDSLLRYRESLGVLRDVGKQGGKLLLVATEGDREVSAIADDVFFVPRTSELLLSILEVVPLQLFAYHVAVLNGCDVDYPRNLAKKTT
jgi:glucosamine--fructose-6-phosphate aminotransferase (isomerizing)